MLAAFNSKASFAPKADPPTMFTSIARFLSLPLYLRFRRNRGPLAGPHATIRAGLMTKSAGPLMEDKDKDKVIAT